MPLTSMSEFFSPNEVAALANSNGTLSGIGLGLTPQEQADLAAAGGAGPSNADAASWNFASDMFTPASGGSVVPGFKANFTPQSSAPGPADVVKAIAGAAPGVVSAALMFRKPILVPCGNGQMASVPQGATPDMIKTACGGLVPTNTTNYNKYVMIGGGILVFGLVAFLIAKK